MDFRKLYANDRLKVISKFKSKNTI